MKKLNVKKEIMKTYILIPVWLYKDFSADDNKQWKHWWDIPHYFMKVFHSKKAIEDYLNKFNDQFDLLRDSLHSKLHSIMQRKLLEGFNGDVEKALKTMMNYVDLQWFVVTCDDDFSKENRFGLMQWSSDKKSNGYKWKYVSYFGGRVWNDELLFNKRYSNV